MPHTKAFTVHNLKNTCEPDILGKRGMYGQPQPYEEFSSEMCEYIVEMCFMTTVHKRDVG